LKYAIFGATGTVGKALAAELGKKGFSFRVVGRSNETLRCHFRQHAHECALLYPGLQDISAWVDFTRVAEAAINATLDVAGYCTQAAFLLATGIEADVAASDSTLQRAQLASEARRLLLPDAMGETFKVMALTRGFDAPLRGFAHQDLRGSL